MAMSPDTYLDTPLQYLKGVGPRRAEVFAQAELLTVDDLLHRFPIRYEDRSCFEPIGSLKNGMTVSVMAEVVRMSLRSTRRSGFTIFEIQLADASGTFRVSFLNQPFLRDVFKPGQQVILFGTAEVRRGGGLQFTNPEYELFGDAPAEFSLHGEAQAEPLVFSEKHIHTGRIVPIYERVGVVTTKMLRRIVFDALKRLPKSVKDPLPEQLQREMNIPDVRSALIEIHFPEKGTDLSSLNSFQSPGQQRMIFEEFFIFQLGLRLRRRAREAVRKPVVPFVDRRIRNAAIRVLPFKLTNGQKEALREVVDDMRRPVPMNRLLQGDVGAGKTMVALIAALVAMENGLQVALMAPTEILAAQHFRNLSQYLIGSGFSVARLSGGMSESSRSQTMQALVGGAAHLVVGTHALLQDPVVFRKLGLVIIDEQHRFGVYQRAQLRDKGWCPDVLVMTATPIPRTLAMTSYGDLDVSTIKDLPPGRRPVKTIARSDGRRDEVYRLIHQEVEAGRQAYVVCPLVEESDKVDLKAAKQTFDHLATSVFPNHRVGLVHGRLKESEKDRIMLGFVAGECDILVSTTVIEIGVDVPNATVMMVEQSERFGLAQLHQLRGRVGRGKFDSHCILMHGRNVSDLGKERLRAVTESTDGFFLAEKDLELRGPGDVFGTRQSGVPMLRVGDLLRDRALMEKAHVEAERWLTSDYDSKGLVSFVEATWEERFRLVGAG